MILQRILARAGYEVDCASNGEEAIRKATATPYDLVLLDLYMQPVHGLQVLEAVKRLDEDTVVFILTAHGSLDSAVQALRLGAYDYLFKPATAEALRSRVEAGLGHRRQLLQRRRLLAQVETMRQLLSEDAPDASPAPAREVDTRFVRSGDLVIDRTHRSATLFGRSVDLTSTEFEVLVCLAQAAPEPRSARDLVRAALGYEAEECDARNIIKWHIHQLRSKIEPDQDQPRYILTVRYRGYLWAGGAEPRAWAVQPPLGLACEQVACEAAADRL
jgi:DNA-binding response OmpR family regulator